MLPPDVDPDTFFGNLDIYTHSITLYIFIPKEKWKFFYFFFIFGYENRQKRNMMKSVDYSDDERDADDFMLMFMELIDFFIDNIFLSIC